MTEAVRKLLNLGEPKPEFGGPWPDYCALGVTADDIESLIAMACDRTLLNSPPDNPVVWAGVHAWRALGQLRAVEAVEPLLRINALLLRQDADSGVSELPLVFEMIGPAALPALEIWLADYSREDFARVVAVDGMVKIAKQKPEYRAAVIAALTRELELFAVNDPTFNGMLVSGSLELKAVESAACIERVYAADAVDRWSCGTWGAVRKELGVPGMGLADDNAPHRGGEIKFGESEEPRASTLPLLGPPAVDFRKVQEDERRAKRKRQRAARKRGRR